MYVGTCYAPGVQQSTTAAPQVLSRTSVAPCSTAPRLVQFIFSFDFLYINLKNTRVLYHRKLQILYISSKHVHSTFKYPPGKFPA